MTHSPVSLVEPLSIPEGEILHDAGEPAFSYLDRHVDVVVEKAECVNAVSKPLSSLLHQKTESRPVYIIIEHVILGITPLDDMVQRSWIVNSWFS